MTVKTSSKSNDAFWRIRTIPRDKEGSTSIVTNQAMLQPNAWCLAAQALPTATTVAFQEAQKSVEARRQVQRLLEAKRLMSLEQSQGNMIDPNLQSAINLIYSFVVSPIDIPIASIDDEGNPSLFLADKNLYLDLTVSEENADYYIRRGTPQESSEIFGVDKINAHYVPSNLLAQLIISLQNK